MTYTIAVTGKGGVGKTTVCGILMKSMIEIGHKPILAIDADPNSCLDSALGITVRSTVGRIREDVRAESKSALSKGELIDLKVAESIVETEDFDLIAMGRPEGPGCYCYANNVVKEVLASLSSKYPYVLLDNEAGLENLSRRIVRKVNLLIMVTDLSAKGIETVKRLLNLAREMKIEFARSAVMINKVKPETREKNLDLAVDLVVDLPYDEEIMRASETGRDLLSLSSQNTVVAKMTKIMDKLI